MILLSDRHPASRVKFRGIARAMIYVTSQTCQESGIAVMSLADSYLLIFIASFLYVLIGDT